MIRAIIIFVVCLVAFAPICLVVGYGIGEVLAAFVYPVGEQPNRFREDRELFAGVYGIMFIGGFLYLLAVVFALFRLVKDIRRARA